MVSKHRHGDGENAVHDSSESSGMAVPAGAKAVVVLLGVWVAKDGDPGPMI